MPHTTLISPALLLANIDDPGWVFVDCRFDLAQPEIGGKRYLEAHIPGALYLHLERDLSSPPDGINGRHPLPELNRFEDSLANCGVDTGIQVVAYDDNGGGFAARLWWLLRYAGHPAAAVLDDGISAWTEAGYPTRSGHEQPPRTEFLAEPQSNMIAEADEVSEAASTNSHILIDSRAPGRYLGENEPIDRVPGHIPGAVNRFRQDNLLPSGKSASAEALALEFNSLLAGTSAQDAIVYCGSGVTAWQNILSVEHAGLHEARLHPGSWSGWITDPSRPIATGEEEKENRSGS
jgi:thiosulfate/3-mercaptopyruvate sulfurtransferase